MRWLCSAKVSSVWVHRTVRWCTGQCPVCQAGSGELAALGNELTAYGYNSPDCPVCTGLSDVHWTVRCAPDCPVSQRSAGPTVGCAICARHVAEPTVGRGHRTVRCAPDSVRCAPDSVRCANGSKATNGRLRQIRKKIRTGQCPVVHRTVRCARRHKARIAFSDCSQWLLAALGL
jgi:hypothetical protein